MVRIRKLVLALVSLLTLALVGVPGAAQAEKRIALVIGNAGYQAGALNTPANDAGLIAQTLQAAGCATPSATSWRKRRGLGLTLSPSSTPAAMASSSRAKTISFRLTRGLPAIRTLQQKHSEFLTTPGPSRR